MENRMKQHQLSAEEIDHLLAKAPVAHLGTHNSNGYPYVVPVHFVHGADCIYIHGLNRGQKLQNIQNNPKICLELSHMEGFIMDEKACDVNTAYQSVVILGTASMVEEKEEKIEALNQVVAKYTPQLSGQAFPDNMLKGTGIIKICIDEISGKYYK